MRDGIQRHFLGSAQFEFRDDVADGLHKTPRRTSVALSVR
jgi:hypothetical protein